MHPSALLNADRFFKTYLPPKARRQIIDIGSQDINGSLRDVCPVGTEYVGVDFAAGRGVDVVMTDPYRLPFEDDSADVCVSSNVFEHSEMFWVLFMEILRVLKPAGLFYLCAPSNGMFHRYPVDCWRFYPDCGTALVKWGRRSGLNCALLESYVSWQKNDVWNDFVAVFIKDERCVSEHPKRIIHSTGDFYNGAVYGSAEIINERPLTEDLMKLQVIGQVLAGVVRP